MKRGIRDLASFRAAALLGATLLPASSAGATGQIQQWQVIKMYANAYNLSGITRQEIRDAVHVANKIFKQAKIHLSLGNHRIRQNLPQPGGDDGALTSDERDRVRESGEAEIAAGDGPGQNGKGLKASFVRQTDQANANNIGKSIRNEPVSILQSQGSAEMTGRLLAHEFGHALGLGDLFVPTNNNKRNLMFGYDSDENGVPLTGVELTDIIQDDGEPLNQLAVLQKAAKRRGSGIQKKKGPDGGRGLDFGPSERIEEEFGAKSAPFDPAGPAERFQHVAFASMGATDAESAYEVSLQLDGLLPDAPSVGTDFLMLFNTDNDGGTGLNVHGRLGIDRVIRATFGGGGVVECFIEDPDGSNSQPITGGASRSVEFSRDVSLTIPTVPTFPPTTDFINMLVPKDLLPFTDGDDYSIGVVTVDDLEGVVDELSIEFDRNLHSLDPILRTSKGTYQEGEMLDFTGSGYQPFESLEAYLDDTLLGVVMADENGSFATSYALPAGLEADFYFFTMESLIDFFPRSLPRGDDGSSVINFLPAPGAVVLSMLAIPFVGRRRRHEN